MVKRLLILCALICAGPLWAQDQTDAETFDVRLELELDSRDIAPIEGEMVLATVRGFYRETITNEDLKLRRMTDFDWIQLKPDHWYEEMIDGLPTVIFERRIAIYPKHSGALTILPIAHELEINNKSQKRELILVRSDPITLEVQPKPAGVGSEWLPVKAIEISDTWSTDPAVLDDGQIAKRRVVLRALGVPPELLPIQPALREPWLITFTPPEERSVQLTSEGPVSTVVWVWSLRPITGALGVIPEAVIPYFDTVERRSKTIALPSSPIGYASFANNATANWQNGFKLDAKIAIGFFVGLLIAVSMGVLGRRFNSNALVQVRGWIAKQRDLAALRRYEQQGDTASFRAKLAAILKRETTLEEDQRLEIMEPIDAELFAQGAANSSKKMNGLRKAVRNLS